MDKRGYSSFSSPRPLDYRENALELSFTSETRSLIPDEGTNASATGSTSYINATRTSFLDDCGGTPNQLEEGGQLDAIGYSYDSSPHHQHRHSISHRRAGPSRGLRFPLCGSGKPISRRKKWLLYALVSIVAVFFVSKSGILRWRFPPLYEAWHARELSLPQHNLELPYPEGRHGKYIWVSNLPTAYGWGNVMQELLMDAYLVHKTGRTFVFGNYTWKRGGWDYSLSGSHKIIPSRIPLTAMLAGPIVGDSFPPGDPSPRSVRAEFFKKVCPHPTKIRGDEISRTSGSTAVDGWMEKFNSIEDPCIEIEEDSGKLFGLSLFGSVHLLDVWPDLIKSPIMSQFRFSPLIEYGYVQNIRQINPLPPSKYPSYGTEYPYTSIPGLLAIQIRRGDYAQHCKDLLDWGIDWQGFNKFPSFPDQFEPVPGVGAERVSKEGRVEHMKRCYPTPAQIAEKVKEVLETEAGKGLRNVYVMTNGKRDFIEEVKEELEKVHKWDSVMSTRDLAITREQQYVKQAIDMLIGLRSQVVIGNGWSSMTSNIVMLRMALTNLGPGHNRFF